MDSLPTQDIVVEDVFDDLPGANRMNSSEKRKTFDTIGDVSAPNSAQSKTEIQDEFQSVVKQTSNTSIPPLEHHIENLQQ